MELGELGFLVLALKVSAFLLKFLTEKLAQGVRDVNTYALEGVTHGDSLLGQEIVGGGRTR